MKKIIAAIAALSLSAFMLTGCNKDPKPTGDSAMTESITASEAAGADNASAGDSSDSSDSNDAGAAAPEITETEAETTEAEPEEDLSDAAAVYASFEEFANADDIFSHKADTVAVEDSYTYAFLKSLENGSGFYVDLESLDSSSKVVMAIESDKIAVIAIGDATAFDMGLDGFSNMSIIMADGKIYMMSTASKSGFYADMEALGMADDLLDSVDVDGMFDEIRSLLNETDMGSMKSSKIGIGGEIYTFEFDDEAGSMGILYSSQGKIRFIADNSGSFPMVIINEFTAEVPDKAFDVPSGYKVSDIMSMDEAELMEIFALFGFI